MHLLEAVPQSTRYWFMRSDGGTLLEDFLDGDFISIGYDAITVRDLDSISPYELKQKIARTEELDFNTRGGKNTAAQALNKILNFRQMAKYDIVVVPSLGSDYLSFGIIEDDDIYEVEDPNDYSHRKRRKVKWLKPNLRIEELDSKFYQVKRYRKAIYDITDWASDISDSVLYDIYQKGDNYHIILRVSTRNPINWKTLSDYLYNLRTLLENVNNQLGLNEDVENSTIKINLQSPGLLNLCQKGVALLTVAVLIGASGCERIQKTPQETQRIEDLRQQNSDTLARITDEATELEVHR